MRSVLSASKTAVAIRRYGRKAVAIDGALGSGKTTIAKALGRRLGLPAFHLDDFVSKRRGSYLKYMRHHRLALRLPASGKFIIEGVCVLEVLRKLRVQPSVLIYVKRMVSGR